MNPIEIPARITIASAKNESRQIPAQTDRTTTPNFPSSLLCSSSVTGVEVQVELVLDQEEEILFDILRRVADEYNSSSSSSLPTDGNADTVDYALRQRDFKNDNHHIAQQCHNAKHDSHQSDNMDISTENFQQDQHRHYPHGHSSAGGANDEERIPLAFRVAGGWVRDKLLRLETHDIDLAVTRINGVQAATLVQSYLHRHQPSSLLSKALAISETCGATKATAATTNNNKVDKGNRQVPQFLTSGRIGIIAANPDQSKHLETATMRIGTMDVDFCHLRGMEVYHPNSRIPTVQIGTPQQDALRRDFTMNALFYNVHTGVIEDWTHRGLSDLRLGQLVTPLDAALTFRDDPLRVLRAIRFAVRYRFQLDPTIQTAARRDDIHQALHVKVSRERVGKELEGMISGKAANPILAMQTIYQLQLAGSVFLLPVVGEAKVTELYGWMGTRHHRIHYTDPEHCTNESARTQRQHAWECAAQYLEVFAIVQQQYESCVVALPGGVSWDSRLSAMAAFLLPFRGLFYKQGNKDKEHFAVSYIFREGVKFKNPDVQFITRIAETLDHMTALLVQVGTDPEGAVKRLDAGMVLRVAKELWVTVLLLATVVLIVEEQVHPKRRLSIHAEELPVTGTCNSAYSVWIDISIHLYRGIVQLNLNGCWAWKPLLDGKDLIQRLNLPQGPLVGTYREEQARWMLMNPDGSKEECEAHLHSFKRKLSKVSDDESNKIECSVEYSDSQAVIISIGENHSPNHQSKKAHTDTND